MANEDYSVTSSNPYNTTTSLYVPLQTDFGDDGYDNSQLEWEQSRTPMISRDVGVRGGIAIDEGSAENGKTSAGETSQLPLQPKRVRLRAVESEREYFLKLMNVKIFHLLALVQAVASLVILIFRIILYMLPSDVQFINPIGIGIWAPLLIFIPTCCLTFYTTRSPSGCSIGSAIFCHAVSVAVGLLLILVSTRGLFRHRTSYWSRVEEEGRDPEVAARIFYSLINLAGTCVTVSSLIAGIQYCRIVCCGRANAKEPLLYDVEIVKV